MTMEADLNTLLKTICPRTFPDVLGLGEVGGDLLQFVDAFQRGVGVAASGHERRLLSGLPDVHG